MPEALIRRIFFETTTRKEFADEAERDAFYEKYVGIYLRRWPELVVQDPQGYCLGSLVSEDAELIRLQPHLECFKEFFEEFPAHLHINCADGARGQGLGGRLLGEFEERLRRKGIKGVHLITTPGARNRNFYSRRGYDFEIIREFNGVPLMLMGKRL